MQYQKKQQPTEIEDLQQIELDIRTGIEFIRDAQGYGELVIKIQIRPQGISQWQVSPGFTRKPRAN